MAVIKEIDSVVFGKILLIPLWDDRFHFRDIHNSCCF